MLWITNVSQCSTTPSALAQRKGRQIRHEHRHSHVKQTFSKRDWPTRVCCVTLSLFCCIWTGQAATLRPLRHCWTNQRTVTHPSCTNGIIFCMDNLYVQRYWICRIVHRFCCKSWTLGFDAAARSSGLLRTSKISEEIFTERQSHCRGIKIPGGSGFW